MHAALDILALVAIVGFTAGFARRLAWSEPLVLVVIGVALSFVPGFLEITLTPDLVLVGLLPPLLYAAAIRTSLVDFRTNRRPILLLSVGLVAFTTVAVGLVAWWVVPSVSLAAAFALGAVVAPPDAVAATTVARRVDMPRRIVAILEGESLVNDATALVALNTAIAAISATITPWEVGWDFLRAAGGGVLIGVVAAVVLGLVRRRIDDVVLDTTLSFAAPYVAFLPAEEIHASGVLAVVVCGLLLGHNSPRLQNASSRIAENSNWRTVQFLLENVVFLLIGLQIRTLLADARDEHLPWLEVVGICAIVLVVTIVARIVWMAAATTTLKLVRGNAWSWQVSAVVSWAGMRGVVTLAAVFVLPNETPRKSLLALAAFAVVAGTLLLQGLTLPWLVRRTGLPGPDPAEDALQSAGLVHTAAQAGIAALDEVRTDDDPEEVVEALRERAMSRSNRLWEQLGRAQSELEPPAAAYRRLRLQMLSAERGSILEARDRGVYDDEVLRRSLQAIDLEESLLDRIDDAAARVDDQLMTDERRAGDCEHLEDSPHVMKALTPDGCEECLRDGTRWVHLRLCLTCGHVGCCDSSVGRHALGHYDETGHPVMRSFEPGEAWRWCYVDDLLG
ncbi:sodium/proton antiporter, CPA1 family [Jatrophihabitans endophyticus]|uniref:Sodium/proton antiporter, CPA1 family n=1 Tax=Jatrophihabitans endophyticus TaxID=1206085 RepID=A0A1M5RGL8_9ACTN|nr:Na+/H+ antiporter [Jatrophihabitans endophyticus]SHH24913.1 sodium/proton antiporter, CPA1 family [Jatrophihabitans endophyticus]